METKGAAVRCWCLSANYICGDCLNLEKWEALDPIERAQLKTYTRLCIEGSFNPEFPEHKKMQELILSKNLDAGVIPVDELKRMGVKRG